MLLTLGKKKETRLFASPETSKPRCSAPAAVESKIKGSTRCAVGVPPSNSLLTRNGNVGALRVVGTLVTMILDLLMNKLSFQATISWEDTSMRDAAAV